MSGAGIILITRAMATGKMISSDVTKHRDEVRDEIDGHRQVGQEQPESHPNPSRQRLVGGEATDEP